MQEYLRTLYEVAEECLRIAAFSYASETDSTVSDCPPEEELLGSRIDFAGPIQGSISLLIPLDLATSLAANMTAQDESDPDTAAKRPDAVAEILNMICGRFLPRVRPDARSFSIGIPRSETQEELRFDARQRPVEGSLPDGRLCLDIDVEGYPARLAITAG